MDKVISPFTDVPDRDLEENIQWGQDNLDNIGSLSAGGGTKVFRLNEEGMWLGSEAFADAPFSVTMEGKIVSKLLAGVAGITIDGANQTIIVNDGTNDRILIGKQTGGF